jgi:hypothetical protein
MNDMLAPGWLIAAAAAKVTFYAYAGALLWTAGHHFIAAATFVGVFI